MKKLKIFIAVILLGSLTVQADPLVTWNWTPALTYENGLARDADDNWTTTLHCNTTPGDQGEPYEIMFSLDTPGAPPSVQDMAALVQSGGLGTYYCAATHYSTKYLSQSGFSNETFFTATPQTTGFVPNPPTNLSLQ